ncbi:hypothetical protein DRW07_10180 [Alteromonas sediminis]|uniref:Solute-binding protein family 3/N-terminal domain-containing protein n=1 Tax=Alteromonas sediminis TaxID=2259342 RepID=A0A3N5Y0P3_9ALTE|nr:transporter substrate-binding domain-containing protein [Alteromonas sediminis]RPJ66453.1 hypothetical protein DRW07_10180 [Alteromonas sediminis]
MKKTLLCIGFSLVLCSASVHAERLSTCSDYTPYTLNADGSKQWAGTNMETLFKLALTLDVSLDTSIRAPFVRCMALLRAGEIDIMPGLIYTDDRAQEFLMVPYSYKEQLAIFYLSGSHKDFSLNTQAQTLLIGVHRAFAIPKRMKEAKLATFFTPVSSVDVGLRMVAKQRLDGTLATISTGNIVIDEMTDVAATFDYTVLPNYGDDLLYFAINKEAPFAKQIDKINQAIAIMAARQENAHLNLRLSEPLEKTIP